MASGAAISRAVILAGDIGGTKTHLALYRKDGEQLIQIRDRLYATGEYPSLEDVCRHFLEGADRIDGACFGVPGPVIAGRSHATNVPWEMEERALGRALGNVPLRLINDLEATAYGVLHLKDSEMAVLQRGEPAVRAGNIAVIAAGTGLGEASLVAGPGGYHAVASEGGHSDFAPRGEEQVELLKFLSREFGHVSFERVLSGPGLHNIYRFLKKRMTGAEPQWLARRLSAEDPAAVVSEVALEGRDPRCVHSLEVFVSIYGAEAANLALKVLALGGVYVGGGIAPKILPMLVRGGFIQAFLDKGRLAATLEKMAVRVSLNPAAALIGAADCAAGML
jgi:glucokinase